MKVRRKGNTVKWGADKWEGKKFPEAVLAFVPEGAGGGRGYDIQKGDWWILLTTNAMARPRPRLIWPNLPPFEMSCLSTCARLRMQFRLTTDTSLLHISPSSSKITASLHSGPRQPPPTTLVLFSCAGSPKKKEKKKKTFHSVCIILLWRFLDVKAAMGNMQRI